MHFAQYFLLARDSVFFFGMWFLLPARWSSRRDGILWSGSVNLSRCNNMDAKRFRTGQCSLSGLKRSKYTTRNCSILLVQTRAPRTTRVGEINAIFSAFAQTRTIWHNSPPGGLCSAPLAPRGVWEKQSLVSCTTFSSCQSWELYGFEPKLKN